MVYGCGNKCVKICVFTFNFLSFLVGGAIFVLGVVGLTVDSVKKWLTNLIKDDTITGSLKAILIAACIVGGIVMLLGFFGCCGAWMENRCLLGVFVTFMIIFALIQLAAGIAALVVPDKFKDTLAKSMITSVNNGCPTSCDAQFCTDWGQMEDKLKCCGTGTSSDALAANQKLKTCSADKRKCNNTPIKENCADGLFNELNSYAVYIGGVAIGLVALEVLAVIFSTCLCCAIGSSRTY